MADSDFEVAIVGGGIVGMATAMALLERARLSLVVLEAEAGLARHQTGHNSGVIHSGLYYKPGSLKARNCIAGREAMYRFCAEQSIAHQRCGKLVLATRPDEVPALEELQRRGQANGLRGIRRLTPQEIREHEPHAAGIDGLLVPETGIVDYKQVTEAFARQVKERGGRIETGHRIQDVQRRFGEIILESVRGDIRCKNLVNCAGLQSDRVVRLCGIEPGLKIVPFRGEYYELVPERRHLVRNLIYPVPDPRFPFLGVHFTRMVHGGVEAGPNAVLALKREGYRWLDFSLKDLGELLGYLGFWRMAREHWKTAAMECYRSLNKAAFVQALRRLVPELRPEDVRAADSGVRAQAVDPAGRLVDDFRILETDRMIHVLNAPSPGATASISIGRTIADLAEKNFGLQPLARCA